MDLNAMKAKLAALANKGKGNEIILKLTEGENNLRAVPLKGSPENPFQELYFHYLAGKTYLSPRSFGEVDPIADFSDSLVAGGGLTKEEYKEAKKLSPQVRTYLPVIVRGKESEGVKFWGFGKTTLETILKIINDEDYGDITDTKNGFDLRVVFTPQEKSDTSFAKTEVFPRRKSSILTEDGALREKLLNEQPVLIDTYKKYSKEELEAVLQKYLNPDAAVQAAPATVAQSPTEWATETPAAAVTAPKTVSKDVEKEFANIFES